MHHCFGRAAFPCDLPKSHGRTVGIYQRRRYVGGGYLLPALRSCHSTGLRHSRTKRPFLSDHLAIYPVVILALTLIADCLEQTYGVHSGVYAEHALKVALGLVRN